MASAAMGRVRKIRGIGDSNPKLRRFNPLNRRKHTESEGASGKRKKQVGVVQKSGYVVMQADAYSELKKPHPQNPQFKGAWAGFENRRKMQRRAGEK